ncbi:MAG: hypothetical protein AB8E82_09860 [Aureispira sp.]
MHLLDDNNDRTGTRGISGEMMNDLVHTSKWLRYLGILGMSSCAFLALVMFVSLFVMSGINDQGLYPQTSAYLGILLLILFFVGAGFMSLLLYRYGSNLKKYTLQKEIRFFEEAIENNKNLWLTLGIFSIVSFFGFMLIGIFVAA